MRWLLTTSIHDDPSAFVKSLSERGIEVAPGTKPTPLDGDEEVYEVEAPQNLDRIVKDIPDIVRINPASKLEFFGG